MPKIIENLKDRLIAEAEKQIEESGYSAVTIRSVAKACAVGVGTVYNYFPSKEVLIATHLLVDWKLCVDTITHTAESATDPKPVLQCVYQQLVRFADRHQAIFGTKRPLPALQVLSANTMTGFAPSWLPRCGSSATAILLPNSLQKAC